MARFKKIEQGGGNTIKGSSRAKSIKMDAKKQSKQDKNKGPTGDNFLDATVTELAPYVENNWSEGLDYQSLFNNNQVVLFGDTNHKQTAITGGLAEHIDKLKAAGVDYLGIEFPREEKFLDAVDDLNNGRDSAKQKIMELAEQTRTPSRTYKLLKRARDAGLEVILVDMPKEEMDSKWSEERHSEERGKYMGKTISEFIREHPDSKMAIFCGYGHLDKDQIPEELTKNNISHKKIALVTAGQPAYFPFAQNLFSLGAVAAVSEHDLQNKYGYVNLDDAFDIDGFIHFPRIRLVKPNGTELKNTENGVNLVKKEGMLISLNSNMSLPARSYDFRMNVDPNCHSWDETNRDKIFEFVRDLEGLGNGQKLYLAIMLENYVRTTMHHGGGSILNMEFDPETNTFGVDTVDTFHYPYDPKADYGPLDTHREVTLNTLLKHFGFEELAIKNKEDLPKTDIQPNPDKPESLYKVLLLLSTYAINPDRISGCGTEILIKRDNGHYIVKLETEDFELNSLESALIEVSEKARGLDQPHDDLFGPVNECKEQKLAIQFGYEKALQEVCDILHGDGDFFLGGWRWNRNIKEQILDDRKELQFLEKEKAYEMVDNFQEKLIKYGEALDKVEKLAKEHPKLYQTFYNRDFSRHEKTYNFKKILEGSKSKCSSLLKELAELKIDFS